MASQIVIVSGACGTGKSTVCRLLADAAAFERTVHIHTDDFYAYIRRGYSQPWLAASGDQNETVITAVVACAEAYARGGYFTVVDGVIGPWFLPPWEQLAKRGFDVRYAVLRPDEPTTLARAMQRQQRAQFPLDRAAVEGVWRSLADLGAYESHVLDTSRQTPQQSAALLLDRLAQGDLRLSAPDRARS